MCLTRALHPFYVANNDVNMVAFFHTLCITGGLSATHRGLFVSYMHLQWGLRQQTTLWLPAQHSRPLDHLYLCKCRYKSWRLLGSLYTYPLYHNINEKLHFKKLQRILQCFTVKLLQWFTVNCCYFFTFIFVKYCVFYSVKCEMLWYIVKNIVKYHDFLPVKYGHPFCPPNTVNFVFFTVNL